jgi:hypothetical protein
MTMPVTPNGSGDCPPESQARAKGNSLNERNQASPTIECSRHGSGSRMAVARRYRRYLACGFWWRQTSSSMLALKARKNTFPKTEIHSIRPNKQNVETHFQR